METGEIARTQHEAQEAERALEEATNNVRMISAHLKNAQEEASKAATRALTAQLQMSVHDQLLVTARQKLNSVTAHMIALQADLAGAQQRWFTFLFITYSTHSTVHIVPSVYDIIKTI